MHCARFCPVGSTPPPLSERLPAPRARRRRGSPLCCGKLKSLSVQEYFARIHSLSTGRQPWAGQAFTWGMFWAIASYRVREHSQVVERKRGAGETGNRKAGRAGRSRTQGSEGDLRRPDRERISKDQGASPGDRRIHDLQTASLARGLGKGAMRPGDRKHRPFALLGLQFPRQATGRHGKRDRAERGDGAAPATGVALLFAPMPETPAPPPRPRRSLYPDARLARPGGRGRVSPRYAPGRIEKARRTAVRRLPSLSNPGRLPCFHVV